MWTSSVLTTRVIEPAVSVCSEVLPFQSLSNPVFVDVRMLTEADLSVSVCVCSCFRPRPWGDPRASPRTQASEPAVSMATSALVEGAEGTTSALPSSPSHPVEAPQRTGLSAPTKPCQIPPSWHCLGVWTPPTPSPPLTGARWQVSFSADI